MTGSVWVISHGELALRMLAAVLMGGAVGMEREWSNHAAGFRTHILVCLGSATIMLLSIYGFHAFVNEANVRVDPSRLAAQVVSGIGFLGAGAILRDGNRVTGLTTAASLWVVAAIGLCAGAGFLIPAGICTLLALISLFLLNKWEKRTLRKNQYHEVDIRIKALPGALEAIVARLSGEGLQIVNMKVNAGLSPPTSDSEDTMNLYFCLKSKPNKLMEALPQITGMEPVLSIESRHFVSRKTKDAPFGVPSQTMNPDPSAASPYTRC